MTVSGNIDRTIVRYFPEETLRQAAPFIAVLTSVNVREVISMPGERVRVAKSKGLDFS